MLGNTIPWGRKAHDTKNDRLPADVKGDRCSVYVTSAPGMDDNMLTCNSSTEKRETPETYSGISEVPIPVGNAADPIT